MTKYLLCLLLLALGSDVAKCAPAQTAEAILREARFKGGLIVHLDCNDADLTAALRANRSTIVHGLDTDATQLTTARRGLIEKGLHGPVSVAGFDGIRLPYVDDIVNLVITPKTGCRVPDAEILRVLAPGGVALSIDSRKSTIASRARKDWPREMDEWPHYLRGADNNAVSRDALAGPPRSMRWKATPLWSRHHDKQASISSVVTSGGRLFCIVDRGPVYAPDHKARWFVEARDAFNGVLLWRKPMKSWVSHMRRFRSGPVQIARLLVAFKERVYVAMGINEPVSVLEAGTGRALGQLEGTERVEEIICHDGSVLAVIGEKSAEHAYGGGGFRAKHIVAVDAETRRVRWRWPGKETADVVPQTLAAAGKRAFLQAGTNTVALGLEDGREAWKAATFSASATEPARKPKGKKKAKKGKRKGKKQGRSAGWAFATLVVKDDVVLSCDGGKLVALQAKDGNRLWNCSASTPFSKTPSVDILVIGDVVWTSPKLCEGRDLRTGKVVKKLDLDTKLVTAGHHHRCYRNKAVGNFIIYGYRGMEFFDTSGDGHSRNNWVRGVCQYGVMPANGLVYAPPHNCGCYPEAMLHGFYALATSARAKTGSDEQKTPALPRLTVAKDANLKAKPRQGPAARDSEWPMYRCDASRSGCTPAGLPKVLKEAWKANVGGALTAPVFADGTVVLARKDNQTVIALDARTGSTRWTFAAGGTVDSAPSLHQGRVLFGSADGTVCCLDLADGSLLWRFRAAPADVRTVALQRVESLWPVPGSILIRNGLAYFAAGRSSYLDGGIRLFGVDVCTGETKHAERLEGVHPGRLEPPAGARKAESIAQNKRDYKTRKAGDKSDAFSMEGNTIDVMSADATSVYLRHMRFTGELKRMKEGAHHLFSTSRLLDDNEAHRSHWFYGNGDFSKLPVAYEWKTRGKYGGYSAPFGRLLVFDKETLWGVYGHGRTSELYAFDIRDIDRRLKKDFPAVKGAGPAKSWQKKVPFHPRALLKAGDALYIGGPAELEFLLPGAKGAGKVLIVSAADGSKRSEIPVSSPPVFDGMAAANGKLFISQRNGEVLCLSGAP